MKFVIDFKGAEDRSDIFSRIHNILRLPDYFGGNLDALHDCLSESSRPINLVFINCGCIPEQIREYTGKLKNMLSVLAEERRGLSFSFFEGEEKKISTVIFDIGNVLIRFKSLEFVKERYGEEMGLRIANAMYGDGRWSELDRAVMSEDEILQSFMDADPGIPPEYIRWCYDHISRAVLRCGYAIPWLRDVRKLGYRIMYLSNYSKHVMHARPEVLDFLPLMDGGIFSCDVKLIKPDRDIFRLFCDRFMLDPEECLFIDDRQDNCEGAGSVGMRYYCFSSYEEDRPEIMNLLDPDL
ncbi:MAG: HAD-IA family hydrolase [Lachnospiraceae bacterium]|nr:HAD-IA family hydrolase [Lachnospiraceae bacterium]